MATTFVPFTHRSGDSLNLELSANSDSFYDCCLLMHIWPNEPDMQRRYRYAFRIEDLRRMFRDAKAGTPRAAALGRGDEADVSYHLYLSHWPGQDRGQFSLNRMRQNVGRSRRTMHDTLFDGQGAYDFEQLYAKIMREAPVATIVEPPQAPLEASQPAQEPQTPPQTAPEQRIAELEAESLLLKQRIRERDQMIVFLRQQRGA